MSQTEATYYPQQQPKPVPAGPSQAEQIATLHARLIEKNVDYQALVAIVDQRIEYVTSTISERPRTIEEYISLAGELRGLRAARGAAIAKRGQK